MPPALPPLLLASLLLAGAPSQRAAATDHWQEQRLAPPPAADSTQTYYAHRNVRALERLLRAADTQAERLLCRYRLYPLTEDDRYLDDLPEDLGEEAGARSWALLSGLWGYRAARASFFGAIKSGRRAMNLMEEARARNADDPFVLLIGGQSLLFRPGVAGGSDEEALARFRRLRRVLSEEPRPEEAAVSPTEAALWTWYALRELDRSEEARALHAELDARELPPLYREFLTHPPG